MSKDQEDLRSPVMDRPLYSEVFIRFSRRLTIQWISRTIYILLPHTRFNRSDARAPRAISSCLLGARTINNHSCANRTKLTGESFCSAINGSEN
ncbi:MAG: hypothetical protein ACK42H_16205, partial [Planctomycetota bacterium]